MISFAWSSARPDKETKSAFACQLAAICSLGFSIHHTVGITGHLEPEIMLEDNVSIILVLGKSFAMRLVIGHACARIYLSILEFEIERAYVVMDVIQQSWLLASNPDFQFLAQSMEFSLLKNFSTHLWNTVEGLLVPSHKKKTSSVPLQACSADCLKGLKTCLEPSFMAIIWRSTWLWDSFSMGAAVRCSTPAKSPLQLLSSHFSQDFRWAPRTIGVICRFALFSQLQSGCYPSGQDVRPISGLILKKNSTLVVHQCLHASSIVKAVQRGFRLAAANH